MSPAVTASRLAAVTEASQRGWGAGWPELLDVLELLELELELDVELELLELVEVLELLDVSVFGAPQADNSVAVSAKLKSRVMVTNLVVWRRRGG